LGLAHRGVGTVTFLAAVSHAITADRIGTVGAASIGDDVRVGVTIIALFGKTRIDHTIATAGQNARRPAGIRLGIGVGSPIIAVFYTCIDDTVTTHVVGTVVLARVGIHRVAIITSFSAVDHTVAARRVGTIGATSIGSGIGVGGTVIALLAELGLHSTVAAVGQHASIQTVDTIDRLALFAKLIVELAVAAERIGAILTTGVRRSIGVARSVVALLPGIGIDDTVATEQEPTVVSTGRGTRWLTLLTKLRSIVNDAVTAGRQLACQ